MPPIIIEGDNKLFGQAFHDFLKARDVYLKVWKDNILNPDIEPFGPDGVIEGSGPVIDAHSAYAAAADDLLRSIQSLIQSSSQGRPQQLQAPRLVERKK
jgi:hypothetical protein